MPAHPRTSDDRLTTSIDAGLIAAAGGGAQLHELFITRFFEAPREQVFEAFTKPNHARQWMGPRGFQAAHYHQDPRPEGKWHTILHQTDSSLHGRVIPDLGLGGEFKEVVPPERLVYTFAWEGQGGQPTRETEITIRFTEVDSNRTKMDFHQAFFDTPEQRDGHNQGWNSSFDKLNEYLMQMSA
ncbi:MAG: SRPBCC domain-containing protein [Silvibacterium sp.]|nr:SRPBCC domain-containing protein [Silvibacterium sp.]